jgi:hypothetical protein
MMKNLLSNKYLLLQFSALLLLFACTSSGEMMEPEAEEADQQPETVSLPEFEPVESDILDNGRMWTFEYAPEEYFTETYGFDADDEWFESARLGAVRLPNCSGSFVSPNGLVMTNHHCARGQVSQVSQEGESLLDDGFYAETLSDERPIEGYYVDQLVEIRDLTDQILSEVDEAPIEEQAEVREEVIARVESELNEQSPELEVQVVALYNGGRYSAYFFRRYDDVRMVMAPELQIGYYGGDADNFTYPRYNLDMSFFRVYDDGEPFQSEHYFPFAETGVEEGDAVFMIGNPGSTTRLNTVAQLTYRGQYSLESQVFLYNRLIEALDTFSEENPQSPITQQLRNTLFGLKNSAKLLGGQLEAHRDPYLMGRRTDNENRFIAALQDDPELEATYIPIIERIEQIQELKAALAPYPYLTIGVQPNSIASSTVLQRGYLMYQLRQEGLDEEEKESLMERLGSIQDRGMPLEYLLTYTHLNYLEDMLGADHAYMQEILEPYNGDKEALVETLLNDSALATGQSTQELTSEMETDSLMTMEDPAIAYFETFGDRLMTYDERYEELTEEEADLQNRLGRGWFAVYGTSITPDATFSPRISDGVVDGYPYNGTVAPAYTTFYGMYDRHYSHQNDPDGQWDLPDRWADPSMSLDLSTPVNFVSTNDIIGGNSGSPVVNIDLEIVGLAFDGNVESMGASTLILDDRAARAVSVDVRGMLEGMRHIYQAERLVEELESARP